MARGVVRFLGWLAGAVALLPVPGGAETPAWEQTLARIAPSVVTIEIDQARAFDTEWNQSSQATGFVVDAERGLILTNRHVVTPGPVVATAIFQNREEVELRAVYRDPVHDFGFYRYDPAKLRYVQPAALPLYPQGAKVGTEFRVNDSTTGGQYQADVTALSTGGFVVTWSSYGNAGDTSSYGVYAQRYDAAGNKIGTEFLVNTFTSDDQWFPAVAATEDGGFVVSWQSDTQDDLDGFEPGVFAQRYDANGNAVNELIITGTSGNDTLRVGAGTQILRGGLGDDVYEIDSAVDRVEENTSAGNDTVNSPVTYTLPANIENLVLTGVAAIDGTGHGQHVLQRSDRKRLRALHHYKWNPKEMPGRTDQAKLGGNRLLIGFTPAGGHSKQLPGSDGR